MSNRQQCIISKLLTLAKKSEQNTKVAAALCLGGKILSIGVNTHRNKFGNEIRCSGHGEIACIHKLFPRAFQQRFKKGYVLPP